MEELNTLTHKGKVIAHHFWNKDTGWLIIFKKEINELEKEEYKKNITEIAKKNKVEVKFENEKC